jgi:hypothetical protein
MGREENGYQKTIILAPKRSLLAIMLNTVVAGMHYRTITTFP